MKHKFVVAFIDFKKAFDSVDRGILFDVIRKQGIHGNLLNAIMAIYTSVKAAVKSCSNDTNSADRPV